MFFSSKQFDHTQIQLYVDNNDVDINDALYNPSLRSALTTVNNESNTPAIKFLGVYIDQNLNFKYHIKQISIKISKSMFFIRSAKNFLTPSALKSLYYSLIHCHLLYALPIWSCTAESNIKPLGVLQKKAIRLITNSKYNDHTEPLFKSNNILPLSNLIEFTKIQIMQNFIQGFLPDSVMEEWSLTNDLQVNRIQLRNHDEIHIPFCTNLL